MKCKHCISLMPKVITENIDINEEKDFFEHVDTCPSCKAEYLFQKSAIDDLKSSIQSPNISTSNKLSDIMLNIDENRYKNKNANKLRFSNIYLKKYGLIATSFLLIIFSVTMAAHYILKDSNVSLTPIAKKEKNIKIGIDMAPNSARLISVDSMPKHELKELPLNYSYKGFYDKENLIVTNKNNSFSDVSIYNIKTGTTKLLVKAGLEKGVIQYVKAEDNMIVWVEEMQLGKDIKWRLAYKDTSDDKNNVLAEGMFENKGSAAISKLPLISISKGKVVARIEDNNNNTKLIVYNLKENSSKEIKSLKNQHILGLHCDEDTVFWSETSENQLNARLYNICSYNLNSEEIKLITQKADASAFDVKKDKLFFAEDNKLKLYDLKTRTDTDIVSKELPAFKDIIDKEFYIYSTGGFFLSDQYMEFENNKKIYIYDLKNNEFYNIMDYIDGPITGMNYILFNSDGTVVTYVAKGEIKTAYIDLSK
ncbi:hypothetical protein [Clostridium manihotivorum]|uniref:Zinc-finger domain-containing protein n=1 Tax=Clostridium manihotivorum TaxID=2320868 RepID=A0A3R5TE42_9CLOT|nr:hypothetical protein [Clostridium manihotivorum]QAA31295.1 hypothetical protein C1I91_06380 [Clostridium manihotivorum]